jgi:hypothetical protein
MIQTAMKVTAILQRGVIRARKQCRLNGALWRKSVIRADIARMLPITRKSGQGALTTIKAALVRDIVKQAEVVMTPYR